MPNRTFHNADDRGAALLVAIGILAILLVISVSFFRLATMEMQTANNYANNIQSELGVDAAIAIAIHELHKDALAHPSVTSTDHAWRTKFNGSWAVGKRWAWARQLYLVGQPGMPIFPDVRTNLKGVPQVDFDAMRLYMLDSGQYLDDVGEIENLLYAPRADGNVTVPAFFNGNATTPEDRFLPETYLNGFHPFVVSTELAELANFSPFNLPTPQTGGTYQTFFPNPIDPTQAGYLLNERDVNGNLVKWLPEQQIHFFTDVDNDGDGLNDSIWMPLTADRLFPNDGLDNDLDGYIDEFDLDGEPGIFLYAENYLADVEEDPASLLAQVRLTMRLDRMFMYWDTVTYPDRPRWAPIGVTPEDISFLPDSSDLDLNGNSKFDGEIVNKGYDLSSPFPPLGYDSINGDDVDNDFNAFIDDGIDASQYVLNRETRRSIIEAQHPDLNNHYPYPGLLTRLAPLIANGTPIRILGEPVSTIIGRQGILITDESSKVNINEAGGLTYISRKAERLNPTTLTTPTALDRSYIPMVRSTGTGLQAHEYDIGVLDNVEDAIGDRIWTRRMGASIRDENDQGPFKHGSAMATNAYAGYFDPTVPGFENDYGSFVYDMTFPGSGFVDDNGSALWMATNGIDDDGDAYWYQHDGIDNDLNGRMDNGYNLNDGNANNDILADPGEGLRVGTDEGMIPYDYDGDGFTEYATLEGIDEPGEYQRFRPYRNSVAEDDANPPNFPTFGVTVSNPNDNDSDGVADEIGELGDRPYRTLEQLKLEESIADGFFTDLEPFITVHSGDNNLSRNYRDGLDLASTSSHTATGVKLDINYASPEEIARALIRNFPYARERDSLGNYIESVATIANARSGAVVELDRDIIGSNAALITTEEAFAEGLRQEDTTVVSATGLLSVATSNLNQDSRPQRGNDFEQIRLIADSELRAYQLAVTAKDFADANYSRSSLALTVPDKWLNDDDDISGQTLTYTQAGVEAIRINEIMVRAVRRVEAEATPVGHQDYLAELDPNRFSAGNVEPDFDFEVESTYTKLLALSIETGNNPLISSQDFTQGDFWIRETGSRLGQSLNLSANALLGLRSVYAVYTNYLSFSRGFPNLDPPTIQNSVLPNLIEYSFVASPQLPAGRYYLTINTQFIDDHTLNLANSVDSPADMAYYISEPGGDSILDTMMGHIRTATNLYPDYMDFQSERRLSPAVVGQDALGNLTGMAFMQNHSIVNGIYTGFTVEIPETGELHIAVMRTKPDSDFASPLAINYFDFSQEPDHEWVELANVSDKEVDISGWRLVVEGDGGIEMTVPDDTYIAPNGYVLLGTNKYDYLEPFNTAQGIYGPNIGALNDIGKGNTFNTFRANGIGLVRGTVPGLLPDQIAANWFADVTIPHTLQDLDTPFDPGDEDFVDNDGNGGDDRSRPSTISDPGWPPEGWTGSLGNGGKVPDSDVQSTVDPDILGLYDFSDPTDPARNTKSWDRIVELEIPALDNLNTPGEIGAFVLRGGIFPNYPEYDGIDNDSDDDFIGGDIYDNNGSGVWNEVGEGIDEGRLRLHPNNLIFPLNIPGAYNRVPAIFNEGTVPLAIWKPAMASLQYQTYPVSLDDPPDWRAFAEKRLFPGDNVIVSLYEGSRGDQPATRINRASHIVDSITYTELDVINRTIDDVLEYTFADGLYNADYPTMWPANTMGIDFYKSVERKHPLYNGDKHGVTNRSQPTDGRYDDWADSSQYWIREIDVTAENLFDFEVTFDGTTGRENLFALDDEGHNELFDHTQFGSPLRMNLSQRKMENPATVDVAATTSLSEGQFEHALTDEGGVLTARRAIFSLANIRNNPLVSPGDLLSLPHFDRIQRTRANPDTGDANSGFPIDFSALNQRIVLDGNGEIPRYTDDSVRQIMLGHTFGDENLDTILLNDNLLDSNEIFFALDFRERDNEGADVSVPGDIFYETETEDQQNDLSNDLVQLIANTAASDALSLSVATAKVVPFDKGSFNTDWNFINQDWSPVLLFPLIGDNGAFLFPAGDPKYEQQYLFNDLLGNIIPATVNTDRWPYERRAVSYASRNLTSYELDDPDNRDTDNSNVADGKEALFIWDGNDGIENGEYDIYLGVNEDLRPLLKNTAVLNQLFGISFIYEALETDAVNMLMDIEIFTDRDGNGRVWNPGLTANGIDPDEYSDLNAGAKPETLNESFEQIQNAVPDRNGFINYGAVTVENNYLAVFIRNRADSTVLNRFTRVILAPRAKTPGRLNINTLETHLIYDLQPNSDESRFFNPLIGIPGIQFGYNEFLDLYGHDENSNPSPTQVDRYSAYLDDLIDDGLLNDSFDTSDSFVFDSGDRPSRSEENTPVQYRAQKITTERAKGDNIHADGRYFESVADLVQPSNLGTSTNRLVYPSILSDLDDSRSGQNDYFMSEETRRFYEIRNRFGRMVNMITTRSDVFKIQVTVQTGTIDDVNGDGILNYRDDREFSVTSEKKASTVYER